MQMQGDEGMTVSIRDKDWGNKSSLACFSILISLPHYFVWPYPSCSFSHGPVRCLICYLSFLPESIIDTERAWKRNKDYSYLSMIELNMFHRAAS